MGIRYTSLLVRRRFISIGCVGAAVVVLSLLPIESQSPRQHNVSRTSSLGVLTQEHLSWGARYSFAEPIDAVSFRMPQNLQTAAVRGWTGSGWTGWEALAVETEFDPLLTESNLVMFPAGVRIVELQSPLALEMHPLTVAHDPPRYAVAARTPSVRPRILSRSEWGADDTFLVRGPDTSRSDVPSTGEDVVQQREANGTAVETPSQRIVDCEQAHRNYPQEFKPAKTVRTLPSGGALRWPQQYSKEVRILAVHHTAIAVHGDSRPAAERVRALYAYHANNRGWGDIGYHFVVDEDGQIYEGRAGGKGVVGGHAYCNNVGSIGIALLGNFELEQPTQKQVAALQWLLHSLAMTYDIDLASSVQFHGKAMPPIVGHGDLVSTTCPGFYMREVMTQVRRNVRVGDIDVRVSFPKLPKASLKKRAPSRGTARPAQRPPGVEGVSPMGTTFLQGHPGSQTLIALRYQAGDHATKSHEEVAKVDRTDGSTGVWQDIGGTFERVRDALVTSAPVPSRGTVLLRVKVQFPDVAGRSTLTIGSVTYVLETSGRPLRAPSARPASATGSSPIQERPALSTARTRPAKHPRSGGSATQAKSAADGPDVRIRLSVAGDDARLTAPAGTRIGRERLSAVQLELHRNGTVCTASQGGRTLARGIVRIEPPAGGIVSIDSGEKEARRFRGTIECRVIDRAMVLINELPLEQYLYGLAEEPDSEPYEKQRAFAIAARSYVMHYLNPDMRKFPGKPYDGSDDPAVFQAYGGVLLEERNPQWMRAVKSTRLTVLTVGGDILRAAYFSASDGKTRSPAEVGWPNFPHAEVFTKKADPWCSGQGRRGHGVGMSGCGAEGQANEGKTAEEILAYYYSGAMLKRLDEVR
ncbi:MAG: N-acetylmuramoyl-L-alanine amidase family 2 protein [Candidatus Peregrinibacteria bacterium Gr01-1014_25]|nr:MAG: N-acetylmuramoyl-L-alanine amidase family 2 protein [Candidatus Peregrinibacteria bacterium Gr01-1014_25]